MSEYKLKVLLVGDGAVGKTSAVQRFIHSYFAANYKLTVGVDILTKDVEFEPGRIATLSIWDIGGQQRFQFIRNSFFKGASGVIAVFDITRYATFNPGIINWINEVRQFCGDIPIVLIGNKNDLEEVREVSSTDEELLAQQIHCAYLETSAKTGLNISEAFINLTKEIVARHESNYQRKIPQMIKLEDGQIETITRVPMPPKEESPITLPENLENGFQLTEEIQSLIQKKVELILSSPPSKEEGFRVLILGNEEPQKPLISQLLRTEGIIWPPEDLHILYNTTGYKLALGTKEYQFQIYFLSNLNRLYDHKQLFDKACQQADGLIVFYNPTVEGELDYTMKACIKLRELKPELEIIITPGSESSTSPIGELEYLEESYKIYFHEDLDTILSTMLINTLKRKEKIDRKKRFLNEELKRMQAKLTEVDNPAPILQEMKALIQKMEGSTAPSAEIKPKVQPSQETPEMATQLRKNLVFLSYSTRDRDLFQIPRVVQLLEGYPEIENALYWEADSGMNIIDYMNENIPKSKVLVLFCSENSINSQSVKAEWQTAFQLKQEGKIAIIPVFIDSKCIPPILKPLLRVFFDSNNIEKFVSNLYKEIQKQL